MKKVDLAYLAGVIDSDGTIGIKRNTYAMRVVGDSGQPTYSERVCVKQVAPSAIELGHRLFGGYRFVEGPSAKRGKPLYGWQVADLKCATLLKTIRPFLRIKHLQADTCIALRALKEKSKKVRVAKGRGHVGSAVRPAKLGREMQSLKEHINTLNRVGI